MSSKKLHKSLKPLKWLIGQWKSIEVKRTNSKAEVENYCATLNFENRGMRALHYKMSLWHSKDKKRADCGTGFLLMKKDSEQVTLLNATSIGLVSLEEGCVSKKRLQLVGKTVAFSSLAKGPRIMKVQRVLKLEDECILKLDVCIATSQHKSLYQFIKAKFEKYDD